MKQEIIKLYDPKQDDEFQKPYVDIDEWRDGLVRYHYIHGGFEGTELRFSFYFPEKENYKGSFFQFMAPFQGSEDASQVRTGEEDKIGFAITNGAYFVESNMGGPTASHTTIYRTSAAAAEYSRVIASKLYGEHRPFGYIYGGSGGGYKTMSCFENTKVWDGAVPYIIGSPMAIPNVFTVRAHALRVLRHKLPMIADAVEPGGSGDIYAGLNHEEKGALKEASKMGFPDRLWFAHEYIGFGALPLFVPCLEETDSDYFKDFWTVPGYLGADPNGSAVRDRIQHKTVITESNLYIDGRNKIDQNKTGADDSWLKHQSIDLSLFKPWIRLESVPSKDAYLIGVNMHILSGDAAGNRIPIDRVEGDKAFVAAGFGIEGLVELLQKIKSGDEVILDNSNFIAIQTYHRHQVPSSDFKVWNQFCDENGNPLYPQRRSIIGPSFSKSACGSIQSGRFKGKMIVVAALLDESAFPWQPDWYRTKIKEQQGEKYSENFRLWYMDNCIHDDQSKTVDELHLISYLGGLHQAVLDVRDWVEHGIVPAETTNYSVSDGQIKVPLKANERKGIQPIVRLKANGNQCAHVKIGEAVHFTAKVELPSNVGKLTAAEWSFEGEIDYPVKGEFATMSNDGSFATVEAKYIFKQSGTYFPVIRVKANRQGNANNIFTQVKNLCRVRVVVE